MKFQLSFGVLRKGMINDNTIHHKRNVKVIDKFIKGLFIVVFVYFLLSLAYSTLDYDTLNYVEITTIMILFIISISSFALAILFYGIHLFLLLLKNKSLPRKELMDFVAEQMTLTKSSYKARLIIFWGFYFCGSLVLITDFIYITILNIINLIPQL